MDPATLIDSIPGWTPEERWEMALQLWASVEESGWQPEPDAELDAELDRRSDAHELAPDNVRSSDAVWERIRSLR